MINKFILGTVQFGKDYGIANKNGKISEDDVYKILDYVHSEGVDILDTAYSYGDSQEVIGNYIANSNNKYNVISKFSVAGHANHQAIARYCKKSLEQLNLHNLYGCLFHCDNNIKQAPEALEALCVLKRDGLLSRMGISIYNPSELDYLLDKNLQFDIIQLPYSIFDQRFDNYFKILKGKGVKIHVRSIFLQGLFFLNRDEILEKFPEAIKNIDKLQDFSLASNMTILSLCVYFAFSNPNIDKVVIGVDSLKQLKENISAIKKISKTDKLCNVLKQLKIDDENIILPYKWK